MFIAFLAGAAGATPATAIDKRSWFTGNDYPAAAQRAGIEGSVTFEVDVDAEGRPANCRIKVSSGHEELDKATCAIVEARAHFKPARNSRGKPVAGSFSDKTVWRLEGPTGPFYRAVILDFSADPNDPACTIESNVPVQGWPTCDDAFGQHGVVPEWVRNRMSKVVLLIASAPGDQHVQQGKPEWGDRLGYVASEQYILKGPMPAACVPIAAEGLSEGKDACGSFPGPRTISDADKKVAIKLRTEVSMFGVARPKQRAGSCKSGESAAEVQACQ